MSESAKDATGPDFSRGDGLVPAIAQDSQSGAVLMMAYMNAESYAETVATGRAVYFSRSRKKLWRKGEESGNVQLVKSIYVDCDQDTILLKVEQIGGAACHEGYSSCFFRRVTPEGLRSKASGSSIRQKCMEKISGRANREPIPPLNRSTHSHVHHSQTRNPGRQPARGDRANCFAAPATRSPSARGATIPRSTTTRSNAS